MRLFIRATTSFLLAFAVPGALLAQTSSPDNPVQVPADNTAFGGSSAEFLLFGSGARGMALGGSFASIVDDVNSLYYNPAGLPLMNGAEATLTVMPYFADTDYYWAGLAFPFSGGDFGMGFFLGNFGFSNSPVYTEADPTNLSGETYGVSSTVAGLSFAHAFIDRFTAGLTLKFISDDLATGSLGGASASAFAIDFGTSFHSTLGGKPINLSFVVQNLGSQLKHEGDALRFRAFTPTASTPDQRLDPPAAVLEASGFPLPTNFRLGLDYDFVSNESTRWSVMGEFVEPNQTAPYVGFGSEFAWASQDSPIGAALRASYTLQPDERSNDYTNAIQASGAGLDGFGAGAGVFYKIAGRYKAQFDYAYRSYGILGSTDIFTFTFGWE